MYIGTQTSAAQKAYDVAYKKAEKTAYAAAKNAIENENYTDTYLKMMEKDFGANSRVVKSLMSQSDDMIKMNAFSAYFHLTMNKLMPTDFENFENMDSGLSTNQKMLSFLDNKEATKQYKDTKARLEAISKDLDDRINATTNENSFFRTHKMFDKTNPYNGAKWEMQDDLAQAGVNTINTISEKKIQREIEDSGSIDDKTRENIIGDTYFGEFSDLMKTIEKTSNTQDVNMIKNDLLDTSMVKLNTYGLEKIEDDPSKAVSLTKSIQKFGEEYIDKRWLSTDLYKNFKPVDMGDKCQYFSMDKNSQFIDMIETAEIFGVSEEEMKTEQFQKDVTLYNASMNLAFEEAIDKVNIMLNFRNLTDKKAQSMAKDFFGDDYDSLVREDSSFSLHFDEDGLKQSVMTPTINILSNVDTKDKLTTTLQNTQRYITETKYLDKYQDTLEYLSNNLHSGTADTNRYNALDYKEYLRLNEAHRKELLATFDIYVKELEKNGAIDKYISYKDQEKLITSPIFKKAIYA